MRIDKQLFCRCPYRKIKTNSSTKKILNISNDMISDRLSTFYSHSYKSLRRSQ